jgi:hypothetical protein
MGLKSVFIGPNKNQCEQNDANLPSATTFFQNGTLKAKEG